MKKIFTLLLSSLFSLSLFAFDGNRLSVSVFSTKMDLKIEIDGKKYSMQENSFTLQTLREGYHNVKIYSEKKKGGIFRSAKRQDVLFNSSVMLKKGFHTDITVNRFGKVFTDERRIDGNDDWADDQYGHDDSDENEGWYDVVTNDQFSDMKEQIRQEWFENTRLTIAQTIMEGNYFSTKQVKELMYLFTFENNRLQIAKDAYRSTVDKENYYLLNDALTFSGSKEELARFIRESR